MKRAALVLFLIATAAMLIAPDALAGAAVDTWIISGQSNACGRAALPALKIDPRVTIWDAAARKWAPAADPLPGMGSKGFGPWHAAALGVAKYNVQIRLAGYAQGGQPISHWDEGQRGWRGLSASIKSAGKGAGVFLWYQGENDGATGMDAATYQKKLGELVRRVRSAAGNPAMIAVIVQLGEWKNSRGDFMPIREGQRLYCESDPRAILVTALGRTMKDYVHLDRAGQIELGGEIARALLKVRYGKKDEPWPGPQLATATAKGAKVIVATFDEAKAISGCEAGDFAVKDPAGVAKCVKVQTQKNMAALEFERAIRPPAKLIYGYGQKPKAGLLDEAGNRAPAASVAITAGKR